MANKTWQLHNQSGNVVQIPVSQIACSFKVVFALTAQGNDFFSAMTRVAVASLRVSNPGLRVVVACDRESSDAMRRAFDPLVDEVDEWLVVDTPSGTPGFRNRYVKTKLRSLLDGPFLFLDSDLFVRGDLLEIITLDCDLAGARNHSLEVFAEQVWDQDLATLQEMGWEVGNEVYINGGVLFYNDTEGARNFALEWHRRWSVSAAGRNYYRDQPALNSALHFTRPRLTVLPDRFNAQIVTAPRVAADAVIWHYYSSVGRPAMTSFDALVQKLLNGARLDYAVVKGMTDCRHPWRCKNPVDNWAAKGLMRHGSFDRWEAAWLRREIKKYLSVRFRRMLSNAKCAIAFS